MGATSAKLRFLFAEELDHAKRHGVLADHVWKIVVEWADRVGVSIQCLESKNNVTVKITGLAPRIDKPLLNARITAKAELCQAHRADQEARAERSEPKRPASSPAVLLDTVDMCLRARGSDHFKAISMHADRWLTESADATPQPLALPSNVQSAVAAIRAIADADHACDVHAAPIRDHHDAHHDGVGGGADAPGG